MRMSKIILVVVLSGIIFHYCGTGSDRLIPLKILLAPVSYEAPKLSPDGTKISRADIDIRPLKEVIIDETKANNRWPEVLGRCGPVDVASDGVQSFFVTIYAKEGLLPGDYLGTIMVQAKNSHSIKLAVTVSVWDFTLPVETHCHTGMFNIADHSICSHFNVKLFSKEHEQVMLDIFQYFALRRIQPGDPTPVSWRSRSFLWMGELNPELKKHWKYQSIANRVDPAYKIRRPDSPEELAYWEKWGRWWRERGLPIGRLGANVLQLNTVRNHRQYAAAFLKAHWQVVESNGWQNYTYVRYPDEIDEPGKNGPETVKEGGALVKEYAPGLLRQSVQTARTPQMHYLDYVDLWFLYAASYDRERELYDRLKREDNNQVFWFGMHNHIAPTNPAIAPRIFFTILRKHGFTGAGLWTSTWNYGKPSLVDGVFHVASSNLSNARSTLIWPAEKGVLFSRRMELIRDGLEDYEYHWLLEQLISEASGRKTKSPELEKALKQARRAYTIPDLLVEDVLKYSKNPQDLISYRAGLAEAVIGLRKAIAHD